MYFLKKNLVISALAILLVIVTNASAQESRQEKFSRAEKLFAAALRLKDEDPVQSKEEAIAKLEEARNLYREINEIKRESFCLNWLGNIHLLLGNREKALSYYEQELLLARKIDEPKDIATTLNNMGVAYSRLNKKQKALECYEESLLLRQKINDYSGQGMTLNNMGELYFRSLEIQKGLEKFGEARQAFKIAGDVKGEILALDNIIDAYFLLDEKQSALDSLLEALSVIQKTGNHSSEAETLNLIGMTYSSLGYRQDALKYLNQLLRLHDEKLKDPKGKAQTLNNLGTVYLALGFYRDAWDKFNAALPLMQQASDIAGRGTVLNNIGEFYLLLGNEKKALEYYQKALAVLEQGNFPVFQGQTLNNIAVVYKHSNQNETALEYYKRALALFQKADDAENVAVALNNIGVVYITLRDYGNALEHFDPALKIINQIDNPQMKASTVLNFGVVGLRMGFRKEALDSFQISLSIEREIGNIAGEAEKLYWLMLYWQQEAPRLAIFYGKRAINKYQELRQSIHKLDKETKTVYLKKIESTYRLLIEGLIIHGRVAEAERIVAMLKDEEYYDYFRNEYGVSSELLAKLPLSPEEETALKRDEELGNRIRSLSREREKLRRESKKYPDGLFPHQTRLNEVIKQLTAANNNFKVFLDELKTKFEPKEEKPFQIESPTQALLKELNQPRTAIITTIVGENRLSLILSTMNAPPRAILVETKAEKIEKLAAEFRNAVKDKSIPPQMAGLRLYKELFPAALQKELAATRVENLVWSLDGALRYVPIAALWDGKRYLVERYSNSVITLAGKNNLKLADSRRATWKALGVGMSKQVVVKESDGQSRTFVALEAVPEELCGVVNDPEKALRCGALLKGRKGVFRGNILQDEGEFTLSAFSAALERKYQIVHIASHFTLNAGNETDSYLLLGGEDRRLNLATLRKDFKTKLVGLELLVLSACNTAMSLGLNSNGVEIESFSALAQNQGAKTVVASLWAVADPSTRDLMTEFYHQLQIDRRRGKADALRRAQMAFLQGKYKPGEIPLWRRSPSEKIILNGSQARPQSFKRDDKAPYAHPYYWSPFILTGNWK